jgi:hypothetical protein
MYIVLIQSTNPEVSVSNVNGFETNCVCSVEIFRIIHNFIFVKFCIMFYMI